MKKRQYRITKVKAIGAGKLLADFEDERLVMGIDVAKEGMVAALMGEQSHVLRTIGWTHPVESPLMFELLGSLKVRPEVAMEPTGTYGDALAYQFQKLGYRCTESARSEPTTRWRCTTECRVRTIPRRRR